MKKLILISFLFIGILYSAYSQSISGTADPCTNENISYTFTQVSGFCTAPPCTTSTGTIFTSSITNDGWSANPAGAAEIASPNSLTTNIKWNCNSGKSVELKFTTKCTTYTAVSSTVNNVTTTTCEQDIDEHPTLKNIIIKCPTPLIINGPTHITCCDVSPKTYSVDNTFGQTNLVWEVSTVNGWEIISGQGTASISARAGSTGASQQVKVTSGFTGCDFETKAVGIINVSRTPIIEEDIAPSLPWVKEVCKELDFTFCVKPISTCATATIYSWTYTFGNTKTPGSNLPILKPTPPLANANCYEFHAIQNSIGDNNGYVDITVTATTPCGSSTKTHRVLIPEKEPAKPTWAWDGGMGDLCVATRNVIFEITNAEEGSEFEWIFNNGTSSYTMEGYQIGTNFEEFGTTWSANPNSNVTLTIRAKNACGYGTNTTFLISAARFKAINDQDCDMYLQKRSNPKLVNNELVCYPNPANKLVTILKPTTLKRGELKIYTTIGKLISTHVLESDITINTENWAEGIYYIYLTGEKQTLSTKIEIRK